MTGRVVFGVRAAKPAMRSRGVAGGFVSIIPLHHEGAAPETRGVEKIARGARDFLAGAHFCESFNR